ncbi:MAG: hypothetical protein ACOYXB_04655 [Bacteroidota bacterium]
MKFLRLLSFIMLFLALGALAGVMFNRSMGVSVEPREVMPANPPVLHNAPEGAKTGGLPWIMFDPGAVGVEADTAAWLASDYDHELRRFTSVYRPAPVYTDSQVMARYRRDLVAYLEQIKDMGATALEFPMFLELVDFDRLGNGFEVYAQDNPMRERHRAYRKAFGSLFEAVDSMGIDLVLSSDMVVLTPELENWLKKQSAGFSTSDPAFWTAYKAGLAELFERFPMVDAFQIRVGEAGSFYNRPNWPYRSELWVDDIGEVRCMLNNLLQTCNEYHRKLFFRSWTIGMGSVGDLHTDTAVYEKVFGGMNDSALWISTKWTQGDFYPITPYNPTLSVGSQNRIIELQARREYEAFSSYPLWIVPYEQYALQKAVSANPHIQGVWIWTLNGGPIRRSPMSLFPHTGDLTWIAMNARGSAALAQNPWLDSDSLLTVYLHEYFTAGDTATSVLLALLNESHDISRSGLAFPTAVRYRIRGLGTDVPAGIYTYWDLVLASTAVNSILYYAGAGDYDTLLIQNRMPVERLSDYRTRLELLRTDMDSLALEEVRSGVDFELSLFHALQLHKQWILHHNRYLHKGDSEAYTAYLQDAALLKTAVAKHTAIYAGRLDHRPFSFEDALREVDLSLKAAHSKVFRWLILVLALATVVFLFSRRSRTVPVWMAPLLWLLLLSAGKFDALSPAWALILIIASTVYALFAVLFYRNSNREFHLWNRSWALLILMVVISAGISAWRGPMAFGFWFWTSSLFRIILLGVVFALLGLHISWLTRCIRDSGSWFPAVGGWLLAVALGMGAFGAGFDARMTLINSQAALLPNSIVHTWGFTQMFGLPGNIMNMAAFAALVLIVAGLLLTAYRRNNRH